MEKKNAFTLVELLAVIVILAVLALITIPIISNVITNVRIKGLENSAYGLIEAIDLYYAQYGNTNNIRFDITNNKIESKDTSNMLSYKGNIKTGTVILDSKGKVTICIIDGNNSAYKNYNESKVTTVKGKHCNIREGSSIVYLDDEATITQYDNAKLTELVNSMQQEISDLKNNNSQLSQQITNLNSSLSEKIAALDIVKTGTIISYSTSTVPSGYLECNGQEVSRTTYANLFKVIGTIYGEGDGSTTFNVPDLRGEFLRGTGTNSHNNQGSGRSVGKHQNSTIIPQMTYQSNNNDLTGLELNLPTQNIGMFKSGNTGWAPLTSDYDSLILSTDGVRHNVRINHSVSWTDGEPENGSLGTVRPTNTSVLFSIKY